MDPVDPGPPQRRIHGTGRAHHEDRRAVAPGIKDTHQTMHQPDIRMNNRAHHFVGDLRIAVRDGNCMVFMQTQQHLGLFIPEVVHD